MECPYCGKPIEESADSCRHCRHDLPVSRGQWQGPDRGADKVSDSDVLSANKEWDPARRQSDQRTMSRFVPPAKYPKYRGWAFTVLFLCFPPTGILAVICSFQVDRKLARGDEARAWRYSQLTRLLCWISTLVGLAIYATVIYLVLDHYRDLVSPPLV
jgi:hypothetical protein